METTTKGRFGNGVRSVGAVSAPGSRWDTHQASCMPAFAPMVGPIATGDGELCIFITRSRDFTISDSCLDLVPFLPPPHSSPSHHLSGRNTRASTAPRGVVGNLTFSPCFFSQHELKQMEEPGFGGVALPWFAEWRGRSILVLYSLGLIELLGS